MLIINVSTCIYVILTINLCVCVIPRRAFDSAKDATIKLYLEQDEDKFYCKISQTTMLEEQLAQIHIISKHYIQHVLFGHTSLKRVELRSNNPPFKIFRVYLENNLTPGKKRYTLLIQKNVNKYKPFVYHEGATYTAVYCDVNIHIRMLNTPLTVAVNNGELTTERNNLSVTDYDAVAYYNFKDGDIVDASCGKRDEIGNVTLKYRDNSICSSNTNISRYTQNGEKYTVTLPLTLKREFIEDYLICHIQSFNGKDYATVRVYFQEIIGDGESSNNWILLGVGSGLCFLFMTLSLIACIIHERLKTTTNRKKFSEVNYQNLPNSPDNTIPNPSQWNEEYYSQACPKVRQTNMAPDQNNMADLYAIPQPKMSRKDKKDNGYVNIKPIEPNYAQVLPKNLRTSIRGELNYANLDDTLNYAKVLPKSQRSGKFPKPTVPPKPGPSDENNYNNSEELNYAELSLAEGKNDKYENVLFNNEPYASIRTNLDYAEPAYCELNILKRTNSK